MKTWEQRERKKKSDYELEKRRELTRLHDEEKEGKRLLAFLEDYNDENDDPKYYKYVHWKNQSHVDNFLLLL